MKILSGFKLIIFLIFLLFSVFSCNKFYKEPAESAVANKKEVNNVLSYLNDIKKSYELLVQKRIDKSIELFNFSNGQQVIINDTNKKIFFISNDKKSLLVANYSTKKQVVDSVNFLILDNKIFDKDITSIEAVALFYGTKQNLFNGAITLLGLNNTFQFEIGFKNGQRKYLKILKPYSKNNSAKAIKSNSDGSCIDWFYVSYYEVGSVTWFYLYTSCGFYCEPNFLFQYIPRKRKYNHYVVVAEVVPVSQTIPNHIIYLGLS